jgi:hypothetical protein
MKRTNNTMVSTSADSGTFMHFNISRRQSDDPEQQDQWRNLTLEEAKKVEVAILATVEGILNTSDTFKRIKAIANQ